MTHQEKLDKELVGALKVIDRVLPGFQEFLQRNYTPNSKILEAIEKIKELDANTVDDSGMEFVKVINRDVVVNILKQTLNLNNQDEK